MIPSRHDYYRRRAHEHRRLAEQAGDAQRAMHDILVEAYLNLAIEAQRRHPVRLKL